MNYNEIIDKLNIDLSKETKLNNWMINKRMVKNTSINAAVIFCELKNRRDYILSIDNVFYDYWFEFGQEEMQEKTNLTPYEQRKAIGQLVEKNIIQVKKIGVPARNHFFINDNEIIKNYF